jgi:hypothetical protein
MDPIKKLSRYGVVKTCKLVHPDVATIVVTKGFSEKAIDTFAFLEECSECFPEHKILKTCITESHFAMLVLTKE